MTRSEQARIRAFSCGVLGGVLTRERDGADDVRLGDDFFIGFLYSDDADDLSAYESAGPGPNIVKLAG